MPLPSPMIMDDEIDEVIENLGCAPKSEVKFAANNAKQKLLRVNFMNVTCNQLDEHDQINLSHLILFTGFIDRNYEQQ